MSGATFSSAKRLSGLGWTCATCRNNAVRPELRRIAAPFRQYASSSRSTKFPKQPVRPPRRKRAVIWAATGTGVATGVLAGVLAFGDQIKYSYDAAERTGRVASGLAICINE
ncbi:hypothetical protein CONLIGDRAFT_137065 [Coniochaeta ligniaria NRRL 30616]|uniref:Uncharacterized protein n=1 Tax=Coniochaeta ligniaria NRRL 30616 TaxID=1408157 RepID=A0A1J7IRB1_9PEZI|nr:hypothetical protein CONLIGDRAFT_137065 [Coniochaeta ligniaria NRRL 30616]